MSNDEKHIALIGHADNAETALTKAITNALSNDNTSILVVAVDKDAVEHEAAKDAYYRTNEAIVTSAKLHNRFTESFDDTKVYQITNSHIMQDYPIITNGMLAGPTYWMPSKSVRSKNKKRKRNR